jgi:hypothetical protein
VRRIVVTHTSSYTFDQAAVDEAWFRGPPIPEYLHRGDEFESALSRAMTVYEAYSDSHVDLFHSMQDDDTGYEIEEYDPDV